MRKSVLSILLIMSAPICGCAHTQTAENALSLEADLPADTSWQCAFTDSALVSLIETALKHNTDVLIANLNVEQANTMLRASRLGFAPAFTLGVEGGITKSNGSSASYTYNIPLTMQWELNLWGQLHQVKAAEAGVWSASERVSAVQLQIIASVASQYYTYAAYQAKRAMMQQSLDLANKTLEVTLALKEAGISNDAAVNQARAELYAVLASDNSLQQQIQLAENALILLMGPVLSDNDEVRRSIDWESREPQFDVLSFNLEDSVPLKVLAQRPDVHAAEYDLQAAIQNVEIARSAFYPSLNISASVGWTNNLGEIVNPGKVLLNLLGSIVQPLFNKGQNIANLRLAEVQQQQAFISFHQVLLTAGTELADALAACKASLERIQIREQQIESAQQAYEVSMALMQNGLATYLEVLTAQNALLESRLALIEDKLDLVQGQINLFMAVGGTGELFCRRL